MKQSMILLHGLFGQLSNWRSVIDEFSDEFDIHIPELPIYQDHPSIDKLEYLTQFIGEYIDKNDLKNIVLIGNSLGGHIAILYAILRQENVRKLVLTGSSGLFENTSFGGFPKRNTKEYLQKRVEYTFYDPTFASESMLEEVMNITTDRSKCLNVVKMAKSAQRNYVADLLPEINIPTLLIWGREDVITPLHVAEQFHRSITGSDLVVFEKCGHVPMMEHPEKFNTELNKFLYLNHLVKN